jgi:hypothetical protein
MQFLFCIIFRNKFEMRIIWEKSKKSLSAMAL